MNEIDPMRPVRKFVGHAIVGGLGVGIRVGIDARRDLTPLEKGVAKLIVTILQAAGHAWIEAQQAT